MEPGETESLADLLFEIGKDLARRNDHYRGAKWLERAYDVLGAQDLDRLSGDAGDLRCCIMNHLGAS